MTKIRKRIKAQVKTPVFSTMCGKSRDPILIGTPTFPKNSKPLKKN